MEKIHLSQVVVVEGKYDRLRLKPFLDALIIQTDGFRIYKDPQKIRLIRETALQHGVVVLTDSDRAGFQLRGFIKNIAAGAEITHLYIPQVLGKEKRKAAPGKENLLGVEGFSEAALRELFEQAGLLSSSPPAVRGRRITKQDFFADGLSGGPDAAERRARLIQKLGLPHYLTANALLELLNARMDYEGYREMLEEEG